MTLAPACSSIAIHEDPFVRKLLRDLLTRRGYHIVETGTSTLMDRLRSGDPEIDAVITNRPEEFLPFASSLRILYLAAAPDPDLVSQFAFCITVRKPFANQDLIHAVETLCGPAA